MWLVAAVFSAVFAAITAILAKYGIKKTDSDVVTVVLSYIVFKEKLGKMALIGLGLLVIGILIMTMRR